MKANEVNILIEELNTEINKYVYNRNLFAGGCCYAAYVLAKNLKKLGIKYRTVLFQYEDILNETVFTNAINGSGVSHVAIEVTYKHRKVYIGDCRGIYRYFDVTGEAFKIRKYSGIEPEEILAGYHSNEWNWCYDKVRYNGALMRSINNIANKYVKKYMNK